MTTRFDVERCRALFPALSMLVGGHPAMFLDGPGGSQVPRAVIDAVSRCLEASNANCGGVFATSVEADAMLEEAHRAAADLVGTRDAGTIAFGANMTTLTLSLARALARTWRAGDEVVVTRLDHDANITPWVLSAADAGATVRHVAFDPGDCTLDLDDLRAKLSPRTRLVAIGGASNAVGTINPVAEIVTMAHATGARVFVDAVHLAPHALLDVEAWDCDFLCCSAYKFFGPHVGILYGKRDLLRSLPVYKLRPSPEELPHRWETGTQNHEGIAGALAAVEYLAGWGRASAGATGGRRAALVAAFDAIRAHELGLSARLLARLSALRSVRVYGIVDRDRIGQRTPTFSFTHGRMTPLEVARRLAGKGIFVWSGNFYALAVTEALGLEPNGLVRVGLLHYNPAEEVDRLAAALAEID